MSVDIRLTHTDALGVKHILHPETTSDQILEFDGSMRSEFDPALDVPTYIPVTTDYFYRPSLFTSNKTTVTFPAGTAYVVNGKYYHALEDVTVNIGSFITAANRKGKDVYLYGVDYIGSSNTPKIVASLNSTYPSGYTAANSRKLGGFHCLCAAVGTISGHTLSGYAAGDILPASRWDLWHRSKAGNEGMVYCEPINKWVDIYLNTISGKKLISQFGGTVADGVSDEKFHWYKFAYRVYRFTGKYLPAQFEFAEFAVGSNTGTGVSSDVGTAGGHSDTAGRRMISNFGVEDCCGFMAQFGRESGGPYGAASWANAWDENSDPETRGGHYVPPNRVLLGGNYSEAEYSGNMTNDWSAGPLALTAYNAVRCVADNLEATR